MATHMSKVFEYVKILGHLKEVKRTGWVQNGVKNAESVAEHMYRMAMMAFAIPPDSSLNRDKCLKMALVHDMAESIVGDITPWCGIDKAEKQRRELESTSYICNLLNKESGTEMYELWMINDWFKALSATASQLCVSENLFYSLAEGVYKSYRDLKSSQQNCGTTLEDFLNNPEYENQSSPEAKFVKDLDKFEMLVQAFEYEKRDGQKRSLQQFYDHTQEKYQFSTDIVQAWCNELIKMRDEDVKS